MRPIDRLPERYRSNLDALAKLRGEVPQDTAEQVAFNLLRSIPRSLRGYDVDYDALTVEASGVEDGIPWLSTGDRVFYDHPARSKDALVYTLLRDRLPAGLTAETYVVAVHAIKRYLKGAKGLPEGATVVVDAGAYVGYKAISYADALGQDGRVVAVEMMPDNFALLERNVAANGLAGRVETFGCALSDHEGTGQAHRKHRQQATIAEVDELNLPSTSTVPVDTLAHVLDSSAVDHVDLLNVQVNGAELDVLRGLDDWKERVRRFRIYAMYSSGGVPTEGLVRDWLESEGRQILSASRGVITAE